MGDQIDAIAQRVNGARGLLLGLDFDGTLAPIADDHDEPMITQNCRQAVARFANGTDATVAVISGRELADLRARVGLDGVVYAGNHGLELFQDGEYQVHPQAAQRRPLIRRTIERLAERLSEIPGWEIEDKGLTATIHVRQTPPQWTDDVRSMVTSTVSEHGDELRVSSGKQVFEIRPDIDWDKGAAIDYLTATVPDDWTTMYLGDDTTDEDAFREIQPDGIGILVGSREETDAIYRLPDQHAVAPFLDWLADELF